MASEIDDICMPAKGRRGKTWSLPLMRFMQACTGRPGVSVYVRARARVYACSPFLS